MERRDFLRKTGMAGAMALMPSVGYTMGNKTEYKLGLQLFSVNADMARDPLKTLEVVKAMGYRDFEIYGFDAKKGTYYGIKASEFKKVLDDLQLTVSSGHYGFSEHLNAKDEVLKKFVDQCIKGAHALGSSYITWPWLAPEQRTLENFKLLSSKLNTIGEQVMAAGLGFAYHNHGFEFEDLGGTYGYEIILSETDPSLVKLQMDMYWVMHSSRFTPQELVASQPGRYAMWHIKDMHRVSRDYTELGNGSIDYPKLLPDPNKSGLEFYYIEQGGNFTHSPLKSAAQSAAYFKEHLQKYL